MTARQGWYMAYRLARLCRWYPGTYGPAVQRAGLRVSAVASQAWLAASIDVVASLAVLRRGR